MSEVSKFNKFLIYKLPIAWISGVRLISINDTECRVTVKHKWINQNPFRSMFWAVQGMAAELTTGAMVMREIRQSGRKVSMLVLNNKANFSKKATGLITFTCKDGDKVSDAIYKTCENGESQTIWMQSVGVNKEGVVVSTFDFEWTIKAKN